MDARRQRLRALLVCCGAAALVIAWQVLRVHHTYRGDWTALFHTGAIAGTPPELAHENVYLFPGTIGFDGQAYHYVAHDPIPPWELQHWVDNPALRYRRILVPLLAYIGALGRQDRVHTAFYGTIVAFVALGAYWTARYAQLSGRTAVWGLGYLLVPAAFIGVERMTGGDLALSSLAAGFALYAKQSAFRPLYGILVAATLSRETGLLFVFAACAHALWQKQAKRAALFATSTLPALLWYALAASYAPGIGHPVALLPLSGIANAFLQPATYPDGTADWLSRHWCVANQTADRLALLAFVWTMATSALRLRSATRSAGIVAAALFAMLAVFQNAPADTWQHLDNYARIYSPLLLLAALDSLDAGRWRGAVPLLLFWPRMLLGTLGALRAVARGLLG